MELNHGVGADEGAAFFSRIASLAALEIKLSPFGPGFLVLSLRKTGPSNCHDNQEPPPAPSPATTRPNGTALQRPGVNPGTEYDCTSRAAECTT